MHDEKKEKEKEKEEKQENRENNNLEMLSLIIALNGLLISGLTLVVEIISLTL